MLIMNIEEKTCCFKWKQPSLFCLKKLIDGENDLEETALVNDVVLKRNQEKVQLEWVETLFE